MYRPPSSQCVWYTIFEEELQKASVNDTEIIILGDLNIDYMVPNAIPKSWTNLLNTFDLHQLITEPTRVCKTRESCLDHIYVTHPSSIVEIKIPHYGISDHFPISFSKMHHKKQPKKYSHYYELQGF